MPHLIDILVIGAGQAGLALGYHLKHTPFSFQLVDRHSRIGDSWRNRYDSLVLFTPRAYSSLPGLAIPGDPQSFAAKDEFADYLEAYAAQHSLPARMNTGVRRLERDNGIFRAVTEAGEIILARAVALATGAFQQTAIPSIAQGFSENVLQFTAETYRSPAQVPPGAVVVVGDGATGRDVAVELAITHRIILSTGRRRRRLLPERVLGLSTWWWLDNLGLLRLPADTALGRRMRARDPFPGRGKDLAALASKGVRLAPSLTQAEGHQATFANGETVEADAVFWATGYRDKSDWVAIPEAIDARGSFIHRCGVSPVSGLYFIGRPWQRNRGSALVLGVGADAANIVEQMLEQWTGLRQSSSQRPAA